MAMKRLYHWTMDPTARACRIALGELRYDVSYVLSPPQKPHEDVAKLAPGAFGVAYIDQGGHGRVVAVGGRAILEYLSEGGPTPNLLGTLPEDRAEARRIWEWIDIRFAEVGASLLQERLRQSLSRTHQPDSNALRRGAHALRGALTFLNAVSEIRPFLAGRNLSVADLVAAGYLSAFDYFGDVQWDTVPDLRDWYSRIKSRPSFRPLLADVIPGARPVKHYADIDF